MSLVLHHFYASAARINFAHFSYSQQSSKKESSAVLSVVVLGTYMRPAKILLLNACFVGVVFLTCARQFGFWVRLGSVLFVGLYVPTILLMHLIPEKTGDHEYPLGLRRLMWPMLIVGWVAAGAMLLGLSH